MRTPRFKIVDHVKLSKRKHTFAGYDQNWTEEIFVIKKVEILCLRHMLLKISIETL